MRKWKVASSFSIQAPSFFEANTTGELMPMIQAFADKAGTKELPYGKLTFRVRSRGPWETVQAFYINRHNDKTRFMRVEEVNLGTFRLFIASASHMRLEPLIDVGFTPDEAELKVEQLIREQDDPVSWTMCETLYREVPVHAAAA